MLNGTASCDEAVVVFPLLNDTVRIDASCWLQFDTTTAGRKLFYCCVKDEQSRLYNLNDESIGAVLKISVPDTAFYSHLHAKKICPLCHKDNQVVPLIYGKPGKQLLLQQEKGEIKLAGCIVSKNSPRLFCKRDQLEF